VNNLLRERSRARVVEREKKKQEKLVAKFEEEKTKKENELMKVTLEVVELQMALEMVVGTTFEDLQSIHKQQLEELQTQLEQLQLFRKQEEEKQLKQEEENQKQIVHNNTADEQNKTTTSGNNHLPQQNGNLTKEIHETELMINE
jgi:hypothetical protein